MSREDILRAYAAKNACHIQISDQQYPEFDRNPYLSLVDIAAAFNVTPFNSAVETIHSCQDNSDSGEMIYRTDSEPVADEALVEFYLYKT